MSLAQLLPAIRELPPGEKIQLLHMLVDDVGGAATVGEEIPEHLRALLPPPGAVVHAGWQVTTDAAGMQVIQEVLAGLRGRQ